jgi:hypothetical protein
MMPLLGRPFALRRELPSDFGQTSSPEGIQTGRTA